MIAEITAIYAITDDLLKLDLFDCLGMARKSLNASTEYLLDSFPVPICDNIRIRSARLVHSEDYRGYIASIKRYFYGIRVQLLGTGIPSLVPSNWTRMP